jgi:hypothetical protein
MAVDELGRGIVKGTLTDGRDTIATAGTAEQVSTTSLVVEWIIIQAELNNTGVIVVGGSTVVAAEATRRGVALNAGDSVPLYGVDLSEVYVDTTVNGDGYTYLYRV